MIFFQKNCNSVHVYKYDQIQPKNQTHFEKYYMEYDQKLYGLRQNFPVKYHAICFLSGNYRNFPAVCRPLFFLARLSNAAFSRCNGA